MGTCTRRFGHAIALTISAGFQSLSSSVPNLKYVSRLGWISPSSNTAEMKAWKIWRRHKPFFLRYMSVCVRGVNRVR